ncbi:Gamma-glutamylputrescine synthetase PuuA [Pseudoruegeria aquimaris]|uniref:Gamma-glutamylputrescine synthetase PuuA n=1 Tax=Pseudoruegeria aquimaris TaxID=393663 RepID=A0A1Y5SD93_9RHOB|nr:glutamine synthetase family protein [Pseudoruegeria aquimaris]SLN37736.1 Gamma-glutamylputrescine synthetase PuuA [Pseudoruegeria aquimaris]
MTTDWTQSLPEAFRAYQGESRIEEVECIIPDLTGMSRGKSMPFYKFSPDSTFFLPISLFYQTITGEYVDIAEIPNQWTEIDIRLKPDMATASAVPWADDVTLQVINDLEMRDGTPLAIAPRNVLKRVLALYRARGWEPVVAPELEFYLTKPNVDPNEPIEPPVGRTGRKGAGRQAYSMVAVDEYGPVIDTIYDFAEAQGLELDTLIQEGGAGQIEINLLHGDPLTLADQVFYCKRAIREAALKNGTFATFMAKPMRDEPGSAMHIHQSVVDANTGRNIFSNADGSPTEAFFHFIGGSQKYLMHVMPLLAPYVNSYRRFTAGQSAPTNLEWGADNRTTGLRIPTSGPEARRVENRVIGIDCNPYLAIAASLACGYLGMEQAVAPRPEVSGEVYAGEAELPDNLGDALDLFEEEAAVKEVLGREFCALFDAIKRAELEEFKREISPWEREHLLLNV